MYKTEINTLKYVRGLVTLNMSEKKDEVGIYVRESVDCAILNEAYIDISLEDFLDLVRPILYAKGCRLSSDPEAF
jgi:hypothetical protein